MRLTRHLSLALTLAAAPLTAAPLAAQDMGIQIGARAPAAAIETLDGKPADLAQYIGKTPVVLEFWATWCPNCKQLEPTLQAMQKKYGTRVKFVAVAVSVNETPARAKAYAQKHRMTADLYFDRKGHAADAYDAPATSYVVVVDKTGKVVYTGLGGRQDIESAIRKAL